MQAIPTAKYVVGQGEAMWTMVIVCMACLCVEVTGLTCCGHCRPRNRNGVLTASGKVGADTACQLPCPGSHSWKMSSSALCINTAASVSNTACPAAACPVHGSRWRGRPRGRVSVPKRPLRQALHRMGCQCRSSRSLRRSRWCEKEILRRTRCQ